MTRVNLKLLFDWTETLAKDSQRKETRPVILSCDSNLQHHGHKALKSPLISRALVKRHLALISVLAYKEGPVALSSVAWCFPFNSIINPCGGLLNQHCHWAALSKTFPYKRPTLVSSLALRHDVV